MRRARRIAVLVVLLSACAPAFEPERPQPSDERIRQLMANARPAADEQVSKLTIVAPAFAFPGQSIRVRCLVPDGPERGIVAFGVVDVQTAQDELPGAREHALLVNGLPCGSLVAVCHVTRVGRPDDVASNEIRVTGGMCEGGLH